MSTVKRAAPAAAKPAAPAARATTRPLLIQAPVHIHGMNYDRARHSLVLSITGSVTISTRALKSPPRLVVDIPSASLDSPNRELVIKDDLVTRVRVSQFKILPPTVRVVLEAATASEPLIAVQQTGKRLYITLAPARPGEESAPNTQPGLLPPPGPEPSDFTPPTLSEPETEPTLPVSRPHARPTSRPGIQTRLRPGAPVVRPTPGSTPFPVDSPYVAPPDPASPDLEPGIRPGSAWRDAYPTPPASPPFTAPVNPLEPTPVPPPRGYNEEPGVETLPNIP